MRAKTTSRGGPKRTFRPTAKLNTRQVNDFRNPTPRQATARKLQMQILAGGSTYKYDAALQKIGRTISNVVNPKKPEFQNKTLTKKK